MAKNFEDELPRLWEAIANKLINKRDVLNSLETLLRKNKVVERKLILDVAGGYGFPSIGLANRGFQIIYNDASQSMFHYAYKRAKEAGAPSYLYGLVYLCDHGIGMIPWQEFNEFQDGIYNALICRGNSLPYAVSWGKENPNLRKARQDIHKVIKHFHRILIPEGILYVDKQPETQDKDEENIGEVWVGKNKLDVTCTFKNDKEKRIRNWTIITKNSKTGETKTYPSKGYLLLEDELVDTLKEVGFKDISKHILKGDMYEGFVAVK